MFSSSGSCSPNPGRRLKRANGQMRMNNSELKWKNCDERARNIGGVW